jgi:hypothetical protein
MSVEISAMEAIEISRKENITIADLEEMGFSVQTAGNANVEAQAAKREVKPELVAAAALLFEAGKSVGKTKRGRPRTTLGEKTGTYPYAVSVSIDPAFKG